MPTYQQVAGGPRPLESEEQAEQAVKGFREKGTRMWVLEGAQDVT